MVHRMPAPLMITRAEEKDVDVFEEDAQLHIKGINIDWDKISRGNYLRDIPSISGVSSLMFHKPITFFVGENGSGKSTLLEAIAVAYGFNPEGGTNLLGEMARKLDIKGTWSVRELRRQISKNLYVRAGISKKPEQLLDQLINNDFNAIFNVREPMSLEFLGLDAKESISESDLEQALKDHLQEFMLELGKQRRAFRR